jgi:RNase P subunit RPR2
MSVKKTISLQEDVAAVAEGNAKIMCNGNLSNYINSLIYHNNKEEIDKLAKENNERKPIKCGVIFNALKRTICENCVKPILEGQEICNARFLDGHVSYVHKKCCRE